MLMLLSFMVILSKASTLQDSTSSMALTKSIDLFGQEKAISNENGLTLRKRLCLETRSFHQKPSIRQKRLIYYF
jgi:hypothetical protein